MAALIAVATGVVVAGLSIARRVHGSLVEGPRVLLAGAVVVWGVGQLVVASHLGLLKALGVSLPGTPWSVNPPQSPFGVGDFLAMLAAPLVLVALLRMPRRSASRWPGVRLALDVGLVAVTSTLVVWCTVIERFITVGEGRWWALAAVVGDLVAASACILVRLREPRVGATILAWGAVLQALADIISIPLVVQERPIPWLSGALWCVAWPVIGLGLQRFWTAPIGDEQASLIEDLGESRVRIVTTAVMVACAGAVLIGTGHLTTPQPVMLGVTLLVLFILREILEDRLRVRLVSDLAAAALNDALTGLPNRRALVQRLGNLRVGRDRVLLAVDLDGFKDVNDLLGTEAGDVALAGLACLLPRWCPSGAFVARLDGDEFAVLLPATFEEGLQLGERITHEIKAAQAGTRLGMDLTASVGVGRVGTDRSTAFEESAAALHAAKAHGGDQVRGYPGDVERARERRLLIKRRLGESLASESLQMHAQPLVELRTGTVYGFESLARWTDDILGCVSPAEFVPIAEDAGLIGALGEFALRRSLQDSVRVGAIANSLKVSVNVSPLQLRSPSFAHLVSEQIADLAVPPQLVVLEVTEAVVVDEDASTTMLKRLADIGVNIAIDDFGTGYSALGYLRRLPVDHLKIDRSWVLAAARGGRTRQIVNAVIELAHALGVLVVMEGIEDEMTAVICRDLGADLGQGWHFGYPIPWDQAMADAEPLRANHAGDAVPASRPPPNGGSRPTSAFPARGR